MRVALILLAAILFLTPGCSRKSRKPASFQNVQSPTGVLIAPSRVLVGRIVRVNPQARFVVINFPLGQIPSVDHRFNVYREGIKVGEVKITGPQREDNIVADLLSGEANVGDNVRDQ